MCLSVDSWCHIIGQNFFPQFWEGLKEYEEKKNPIQAEESLDLIRQISVARHLLRLAETYLSLWQLWSQQKQSQEMDTFESSENYFRKTHKSHVRIIYCNSSLQQKTGIIIYFSKNLKMQENRGEEVWNCHTQLDHQLWPHTAGYSVSPHLKRFIYHVFAPRAMLCKFIF